MFGALRKLCNNIKKIDERLLFDDIMDDDVIRKQFISLNQEQLYTKGVDAQGETLGDYSKRSVEEFGKRPGRIQLYETGATYDSMSVVSDGDGLVIQADMDLHGVDLNVIYPHALGLTEESIDVILPNLSKRIVERILDAR